MIHMLNCGGCLVKQPRRIMLLCLFSRDDIKEYFSLFPVYICQACFFHFSRTLLLPGLEMLQ